MLENLSLDVLIPVVITLIGFLSYYFGKIIIEEHTGIEEKSQNYIIGFIFVLIYLILPLSILYYFKESLIFKLNIYLGIGFFILLSFIMKYFDIKKNVHMVSKGQAYEEFEKESLRRTNHILSGIGLSSDNNYITRVLRFAFMGSPYQITVQILTYIAIFLVTNLIYSTNIIFAVFFFTLFAISMGNVAILSVAKSITYPEVILEDNSGKEYKGRILKYGKEFVAIRDKRKVYNFSRENIKYIMTTEKLPFNEESSKKEASQP